MQLNLVLVKCQIILTLSVLCENSYVYGNRLRAEEEIIEGFMRTLTTGLKLLTDDLTPADATNFAIGRDLEDVHLSIVELITKYGYPLERYEIITEDGYILTLFRIPASGRPIFLMHGLLMSADDWVTPGPERGIAFLLAAEGFDVWLGNARGTKHSRRHLHLSPESAAFWDFSWDEMGRYDLPATIDFILNTTSQCQLIYIGHSQGTTSLFVMGSLRPEYNSKVSLMIALAPVGAVPNIKSPFLLFVKYASFMHSDVLFSLVRRAGLNEFIPKDGVVQGFGKTVCGNGDLARVICSNLVFLICGFSYSQLNFTNLPVLFSHSPSGASTKQLEHYAQTVTFRRFQRFDYGTKKNLLLYGSTTPSEYNVGIITTPLALFYSANDWLTTEPDVLSLRSKLKNVVDFHKVPDKTFNHVDFLFAKDIKKLIWPRLLKLVTESL